MAKHKVGLHSKSPVPLLWLEDKARECIHFDSAFEVVEICYGDYDWEMEDFWDLLGKLQVSLIEAGLSIDMSYFMIDMKRYDNPMIVIQN